MRKYTLRPAKTQTPIRELNKHEHLISLWSGIFTKSSGPSCSKLTMSLVNDSLKFTLIRKYSDIFCWKNVNSFCSAKATHIFSAKNIRILCIESAKTVNEMTLNELVKLTMLWTTGPCYLNSAGKTSLKLCYCILSIKCTAGVSLSLVTFLLWKGKKNYFWVCLKCVVNSETCFHKAIRNLQ